MPSASDCNQILAVIKELGGSATTAEIAQKLNLPKEMVGRFIQSMRKFGMLQSKCGLGTGYGLMYELKEKARA